jgi:hypothetical protein
MGKKRPFTIRIDPAAVADCGRNSTRVEQGSTAVD